MSRYMIEILHDKAACTTTIHEFENLPNADGTLEEFDWGCDGGEHRAWAVLEAGSESAARDLLPQELRNIARITEVRKRKRSS